MKKILITMFSMILLLLIGCYKNEIIMSEPNPQVLIALEQTKKRFTFFNDLKEFYYENIKDNEYNYYYINQVTSSTIRKNMESYRISYSEFDGERYNDVYILNNYKFYDEELGNYVKLGMDGSFATSMAILIVSYNFIGELSDNLTFVHNNIKTEYYYYNYEVNVYSNDVCIMTMWYDTELVISRDYVENMIIAGIEEL